LRCGNTAFGVHLPRGCETAALGEQTAPIRKAGFQTQSWTEDGIRYFAISDVNAQDVRQLAICSNGAADFADSLDLSTALGPTLHIHGSFEAHATDNRDPKHRPHDRYTLTAFEASSSSS